jgi:NAD(P)H-hydrate epimerase
MYREALVRAAASQTMDAEAADLWSFNSFALVEAAGRGAAGVLLDAYPRLFGDAPALEGPFAVVLAGTGNNGADAMVILRSLILWGKAPVDNSILLVTEIPGGRERGPAPELYRSLVKMGVRVFSLSGGENPEFLRGARLIIDGLCGTGLRAPLREAALAGLLNSRDPRSFLVSVDVPSGLSDDWRPDMPVLRADATLAIEPEKLCLYKPAARSFCGRILHVGGIFPRVLTEKYRGAELVGWDYCRTLIPPVPGDSYKYGRGLAEIRAGAPGSTGAARIAARGAQAAGAGLVRLLVDPAIHPILAASASAVMVAPDPGDGPGADSGGGLGGGDPRFKPDAVLLGPGWGRGPERRRSLEEALVLEEEGIPLVLDADAIYLAGGRTFHGNALLTPHPGELAAYSGTSREELLADPGSLLLSLARERKALILFKSHVLFIASPSGDLAVVDGMRPVLAAGGTGDLLAGFCAGIAARRRAMVAERRAEAPLQLRGGDLYACALAGASLLIRSAEDPRIANRFAGPLELADIAADLAGQAWLPGSPVQGGDDGRRKDRP